jgi:hypothetical protein
VIAFPDAADLFRASYKTEVSLCLKYCAVKVYAALAGDGLRALTRQE